MSSPVQKRIVSAGSPRIALATVLVGNDAPSQKYVASKHRTAQQIGIQSVQVELPETCTQADLESEVLRLAGDDSVHGILVQMPLPAHLNAESVLALIPAAKDVDGLTSESMGISVARRWVLCVCCSTMALSPQASTLLSLVVPRWWVCRCRCCWRERASIALSHLRIHARRILLHCVNPLTL